MKAVIPTALHDDTARFLIIEAELSPGEALPASYSDTDNVIMTEWEASKADILRLINGGRLRVWLAPAGMGVVPLILETVDKVDAESILNESIEVVEG